MGIDTEAAQKIFGKIYRPFARSCFKWGY